MADETASGLPYPELPDDNNPPADFKALAEAIDAIYGANVANFAALPAAGDFVGQRIFLVDVKQYAQWDGSSWGPDWTAYSPAIVGTAAPTLDCKYIRTSRKLVTVQGLITLTAGVTADLSMALPSTAASPIRSNLGGVTLYHPSTGAERQAWARLASTTSVQFSYENATPAQVLAGVGNPWTWVAADKIFALFSYQEA